MHAMPHERAPRHARRTSMKTLLRQARREVLPLVGVEDAVERYLPVGTPLTVTASPAKGLQRTVEVTERLSRSGYDVTPHLSARLVEDRAHLHGIVDRLCDAGVRDVFVVAGDAVDPVGELTDALALLKALDEVGHDFTEIGVAGYPEGHPFIGEDTLTLAMLEKAPYATYVVSQICFDPRRIVEWAAGLWDRGIEHPVKVGVPGRVSRTKLLRVSARIGLGESARFLRKQHNWLLRLLMPGVYDPTRLVEDLESSLTDVTTNVDGFHIYTFNDLARSGVESRHEPR